MKLSIIIPIYNTAELLTDCVESIFEQNLSQEDFEMILINDGSTDNSSDVCNVLTQKHKNIRVIHQENKGQSAARNLGLNQAKGKYIYFIDSDDYLKSGYLNELLTILEKEDLDFIGFGTYNASEKRISTPRTESLRLLVEGDGFSIIAQHAYYNGSCWYLFEKELAKNLFFEQGRVCEDVLFTTQLLLRVKKGYIYENPIYAYYIKNNESTVRTKNKERLHKITNDMFYVTERFSEIIEHANSSKNSKVFHRLKGRQESYTYFAIIRFIRSKRSFSELALFLANSKACRYPAYPINNFKGYSKKDKILIECFNNKITLQLLLKINQLTKIIS